MPRTSAPCHRNTLAERDRLICANLRLVDWLVARLRGRGSDMERRLTKDDATGAGRVGLIIAAERYDEKRGTQFSTYASWWIRREILTAYYQTDVIHVPQYYLQRQTAIPIRPEYLADAMAARNRVKPLIYKNEQDCETTFAVGTRHQEDDHDTLDDVARLRGLMEQLDERSRLVLEWRSAGIGLKEIGATLHLSKERCRQIQAAALVKLREWW